MKRREALPRVGGYEKERRGSPTAQEPLTSRRAGEPVTWRTSSVHERTKKARRAVGLVRRRRLRPPSCHLVKRRRLAFLTEPARADETRAGCEEEKPTFLGLRTVLA